MVSVIPMVGLVLVVLCANFHRQTLAIARHAAALVPLFGGFWIAGAAFVAVEPGFERERLPRLATYAATTLGLCLLFLALYDRWTVPRGLAGGGTIENVMLMASFSARRIAIIHGFVLSVVALFAAIAFAREDQSGLPLCRRPLARLVGYAALVPAVVLAVNATNVSGSRADTISKLAINYEASGKLTWAAALQEEALALRPWEDRYALELGSIRLQQAERDGAESAEQTTDLEHAREAFERAARTSPLDPDHSRNLAKLHRFWAKVAANGDERRNHLRAADEEYRRAAVLMPLNPFYRAEWATLFLENGDGSRALELLDEAEALDPQYTTTYWLRANLRAGRGELDEAVAEYDRALAIDPTMMASLSGKALALARLDRLDEAIEVCEDALEIDRHDPVSWSNLVTLLRQKGDTAGALDRAEAALKAVRKKYRPTFEEMIAQLR
jgi:tetratricopeptide (TPR) repeat protein